MELLPNRQVHLDFHTGPDICDVGVDFEPAAFADTLHAAHVNSVTLFAKCHHGHLYYETKRPERHPGLKPGHDLLGQQIEACKRKGIRTPIYLSVLCDEYAANLHPEWIAINPDGSHVGRKPLSAEGAAWQIMDMSSPYADFLAEQIEEVVKRFKPVDGVFLDMCWDQPSVSHWAKNQMVAEQLDPSNESDQMKFAQALSHRYMARYNKLIESANGDSLPRVWYNSRPKTQLVEDAKFLKHIEIEALPTGGWGYTYFPLNVRWSRHFGLPFIGMTARFHKSWSDFGGFKPRAAMKYEVSQMLAHGGGCSIGDQLHPRGTLDAEAYFRIGKTYEHVRAVEAYCIGASPVTEVAVLRDPAGKYQVAPGDTLDGVVRMLQQLAIQFDIVAPNANVEKYRLVIVPDNVNLTGPVGERLNAYALSGGKVILAGPNAIATAPVALRKGAGVAEMSNGSPEIKTVFFRYEVKLIPLAERSDVICYDGTNYLRPEKGALLPAKIVEPYFERAWNHFSGHFQTPPAKVTESVPVTLLQTGAAFGFDPFKAYAQHGQTHLRELISLCLRNLMPDPLVKSELPSHAEVTVTQQTGRTIVHVLSYAPQRRTPTLDIVEDATPLVNRKLSIRVPKAPVKVTRQPAGESLRFEYADGYATIFITSENGHDILVFE